LESREVERKSPKTARAGRGQNPKWEIPVKYPFMIECLDPPQAKWTSVNDVVVLVHGTFACKAPWTMKDSEFCRAMRREFGPNPILCRFQWSGKNTHEERRAAGDQLAADLEEIVSANPQVKIFLITHSHGGNVVRYAVRGDVQSWVPGIVSLGAPFFEAVPRDTEDAVDFASGAIAVFTNLLFAPLLSVPLLLLTRHSDYFVPAICCVLLLWFIGLRNFKRMGWTEPSEIASQLRRKIAVEQERTKSYFVETLNAKTKIFQVISRRDEAYLWLRGLANAAESPFRGWNLWHRYKKHIMWAMALLCYVVIALRFVFDFTSFDVAPGFRGIYQHKKSIFEDLQLLFMTAPLWSGVFIIALMAVLPRLIRADKHGFGGETIYDNLFSRITVTAEPGGFVHSFVEYVDREPPGEPRKRTSFQTIVAELNHCRIYRNPQVLERIFSWLRTCGLMGANSQG
jgi:hypothetical protein